MIDHEKSIRWKANLRWVRFGESDFKTDAAGLKAFSRGLEQDEELAVDLGSAKRFRPCPFRPLADRERLLQAARLMRI